MRQVYIGFLALLILGCIGTQKKQDVTDNENPPNIIFIMSDDHAYQAISAYDHGFNQTPNIDRIAQEDAIFNRFFVINSIGAPSRAVMLTGKHSHVHGKVDNISPFNWDQDSFVKLLRAAGYETALIDKIHLDGLPHGFDYSNVLPGQGQYYAPDFIENGVKKKNPGYVTEITTNLALDWLSKKRDRSKPFLLLYHQKVPHRTWMPKGKNLGLFHSISIDPLANFFDDYAGRTAAKAQEMSILENLDLVYDLKLLDKEGDIKTRYRDIYSKTNTIA